MKAFGSGSGFSAVQWRWFPHQASVVRDWTDIWACCTNYRFNLQLMVHNSFFKLRFFSGTLQHNTVYSWILYILVLFWLLAQSLSDKERMVAYQNLLLKVTFLTWIFGIFNLTNANIISSSPKVLNKNNELKELWRTLYSNR